MSLKAANNAHTLGELAYIQNRNAINTVWFYFEELEKIRGGVSPHTFGLSGSEVAQLNRSGLKLSKNWKTWNLLPEMLKLLDEIKKQPEELAKVHQHTHMLDNEIGDSLNMAPENETLRF